MSTIKTVDFNGFSLDVEIDIEEYITVEEAKLADGGNPGKATASIEIDADGLLKHFSERLKAKFCEKVEQELEKSDGL